MLEYKEFPITEESKRFVNLVCSLKLVSSTKEYEDRMMLPNGSFNLAILRGNKAEAIIKGEKYRFEPGFYLISQMTEVSYLRLFNNCEVLFVEFPTWTFSYFPEFLKQNFVDTVNRLEHTKLSYLDKIDIECDFDMQLILERLDRYFNFVAKKFRKQNIIEVMGRKMIEDVEKFDLESFATEFEKPHWALKMMFRRAVGVDLNHFVSILRFRESIRPYELFDESSDKSYHLSDRYHDYAHFYEKIKDIAKLSPVKIGSEEYTIPELF
jgi:hypothetical protein